ncbi:putative RNase H-like HicB family nuclease [Rhodopseudomonas rhenobacensis]|uniref:Putative RNase H-like HicB family nuclease n=1 Tax=Rhodopseudomonas rhenobacensis TaxID=87461 RepID=A0A7W7Z3B5_9BRAD|nr:type II toxin-antitoxin system HicB family antitoxin [Rhodopseudomonas rhenobacensis]MBB5047206.1 putative RNase H-like HicB family nuclease [Rhodopseudomonas rhenobacensis]
MPLYIAVIRDHAGHFTVSFPDVPGLVTAGDDYDEAVEEAVAALEEAGEEWTNPDGSTGLKPPRSFDELQDDPAFLALAEGATLVEIEWPVAD